MKALFLASLIYTPITILRNMLYNKGVLKTHALPVPVISVGNITAGGTGKSPLVILIGGILTPVEADFRPCSRAGPGLILLVVQVDDDHPVPDGPGEGVHGLHQHVEHKLGVKNSIASFTIPLGATVNMDGTAIMQGVATGFIAQAYGIDLLPIDYLMVVLTATLASIGTAGVPGVGLIMLAMVLRQVNLPVEGIALVLGVDRLLDMVRTAVNVTGDASVSCIVAASEGELSRETLRGKASGA